MTNGQRRQSAANAMVAVRKISLAKSRFVISSTLVIRAWSLVIGHSDLVILSSSAIFIKLLTFKIHQLNFGVGQALF